ncbi:hypothetical protein HDU83_009665 [Entophlyctis luteolus]|nr:hypothetical protein HDU83_009665 [Entophlyctis luteolus]
MDVGHILGPVTTLLHPQQHPPQQQQLRSDQMRILRSYYDLNPMPSSEAEIGEHEHKVMAVFANWRSNDAGLASAAANLFAPVGNMETPSLAESAIPENGSSNHHAVLAAGVLSSSTSSSPAPSNNAGAGTTIVDSVKIRPPPKRVTNFTTNAFVASQTSSTEPETLVPGQVGAGATSASLARATNNATSNSYPPPPNPVHASLLPPFGRTNIMRLMMSSYFVPCTVEDFEIRRRRRLDDEAASNVVKRSLANVPTQALINYQTYGGGSPAPAFGAQAAAVAATAVGGHAAPQQTVSLNLSGTLATPQIASYPQAVLGSPIGSSAGTGGFQVPPKTPTSSDQSLSIKPLPNGPAAAKSQLQQLQHKPKSKKSLSKAAKLIIASLKKLKKASPNGVLDPKFAVLLKQAKASGLLPDDADFEGDDDLITSEGDGGNDSGSEDSDSSESSGRSSQSSSATGSSESGSSSENDG